eukprot:m.832063 g.832063  ORF g.832063 m.832063 type:complete len:586 (-) comp23432_c0_seq5:333-2090(-)
MSEAFKCSSCAKAIDGRALMVGGGYFCPACFVCTACTAELKSSFLEKDGKHFCVPCYHEKFSPKCNECSKSITGPVLSMGGKSFCPECFKCDFCSTPIKPSEGLAMRKDKRCCASCKPNFCCCGCGEYCPESNRILVDGIEKPFLLHCLKCKTCQKQLYKNDAKVFNSRIFCDTCVQKERESTVDLSQPCAKCNHKIQGKALLALDKQWCAGCFVCTNDDCGVKLTSKFFEFNGMPYCDECKTKPKKKLQAPAVSNSDDALPPIPANTDGGEDNAPEYAEVDDTCTDVGVVADNEPDYDNHDFSSLPPPPLQLSGASNVAETSDDYDYYEMAQKQAPPPPPMLSDSSDTYDNGEHGTSAGDGTYDNADHVGAGGGEDDTYDNADHGACTAAGEDEYDNADHGAAPSVGDTYDNSEHGVVAGDDTYDNAEHGVATGDNEYALPADAVSASSPSASDDEVEKRVRERIEMERQEMERKIRQEIEQEMRAKSSLGPVPVAATSSAPPKSPSTAPAHLQHQPNPLYQSADTAAPPQVMSPEKDLLSSWLGKKPAPGSASPGTQRKLQHFSERRELPKPRTMSARLPSSK